MILRFILWWISRPRSLYETEMVYWRVRNRILVSFPYMREELNAEKPFFNPDPHLQEPSILRYPLG